MCGGVHPCAGLEAKLSTRGLPYTVMIENVEALAKTPPPAKAGAFDGATRHTPPTLSAVCADP